MDRQALPVLDADGLTALDLDLALTGVALIVP
ncbi:hypothetical protein HDA31_005707 [Micromonospora carbonacea subsp. aurantiaca]|nr:hypothetical protein [Micromonospora carbonacea]